jgi:hypothetical protein
MSITVKIVWYGYYREGDRWEEKRLESIQDEMKLCADWKVTSQELIIYPVVEADHVVEHEIYWRGVSQHRIPDAPPWRGGVTPGP